MKRNFAGDSCSQHLRDSLLTEKSFILFPTSSDIEEPPPPFLGPHPRDCTANHEHYPASPKRHHSGTGGFTCMAAVNLVFVRQSVATDAVRL